MDIAQIDQILNASHLPQAHAKTKEICSQDSSQDYLVVFAEHYRSHSDLNPVVYDEIFYLTSNSDVMEGLLRGDISCGLHHFLGWGFYEKRAPNLAYFEQIEDIDWNTELPVYWDQNEYLLQHEDVRAFIHEFPHITTLEFAKNYGARLGHFKNNSSSVSSYKGILTSDYAKNIQGRADHIKLIRTFFDEEYYCKRYDVMRSEAFNHYLTVGIRKKHSPNDWFDEEFYRALYSDIDEAVITGKLACGFEHYLLAGQQEQRLGKYDLQGSLEAFMPGITRPTGISNLSVVASKVEPCNFMVDAQRTHQTIWLVLPFINPDIMFGGFASFVNFADTLLRRGHKIGLFLREAHLSSLKYFLHRDKKSLLARRINEVEVFSPLMGDTFRFGVKDLFICYSTFDSLCASSFAAETELKKPIQWIQEYEPIFHRHDYIHFLSTSAYHTDHFGIFNSEILRDYFVSRGIGKYANKEFVQANSFSYEHVLHNPGRNDERWKKADRTRTFFLYSRPEEHATRNLFEIAVYALRQAVKRGAFKGSWEFVGLGALGGPYSVDLGEGKELKVMAKITSEEYRTFIQNVDVGLSLMYAPHPSLLPFELALSGAHVVTNTFEVRGEDYILGRAPGIITFEPTIPSCVEAISIAAQRAMIGPSVAISDKPVSSWEEVFDDRFFDHLNHFVAL